MNIFLRLWFGLIATFVPLLALADNNILDPDPLRNGTDMSINYLATIFGIVDGVLHGSGSQIMGHMFSIFNSGALFIGSIILGYTTIVGTLNTAHEGEFLGKKWSSIWIPIRSAIGIVLLLPRATGYSTLQVLVMWVIVQGVGLADSVWNTALDYLRNGGVLVQQALPVTNNTGLSSNIGQIFVSEACMATLQNSLRYAYNQAQNQNMLPNGYQYPPNLLSTVVPIKQLSMPANGDDLKQVINFPGDFPSDSPYQSLTGVCGSVSWVVSGAANRSQNYKGGDYQDNYATQQDKARGENLLKVLAAQQMIMDLYGPAQAVANLYFPVTGPISIQNNSSNSTTSAPDPTTVVQPLLIADTMSDVEGILEPLLNNQSANNGDIADAFEKMKAQGWIMAGAYYWILSNVNASNTSQLSSITNFAATNIDQQKFKDNLPPIVQQYASDILNPLGIYSNLAKNLANKANTDDSYGGHVDSMSLPPGFNQGLGAGAVIASGLFTPLGGAIAELINIAIAFAELAKSQSLDLNPVLALAFLGSSVIGFAFNIWLISAAATFAITTALSGVPCMALGTIGTTIALFIVPFIAILCTSLFVVGSIEAFYVPLIPMIIFIFSAIGWIIAVIEAMVAAPLVALGITHPEGHEVVGKADQGLLLLISVFLTPSMMIIGFIAGIILSFVGVWLLNNAFWGFFTNPKAVSQYVSGFAWLFVVPSLLFTYTYLVMQVVNQAFSLIHVIPDKVMRWIGAPSGVGIGEGAREALSTAKGAAENFARDVGGGLSRTGDQGAEKAGKLEEVSKTSKAQAQGSKGGGGKSGGGKASDEISVTKPPIDDSNS